jgi:hypothetical protein
MSNKNFILQSLNFECMKRFKIGFLALIALIAMSFTLASQSEVLSVKNSDNVTTNCYTSTPGAIIVNDCLTSAPTGLQDADTFCENQGSVFCCAEVVDDATSCPSPTYVGKKISALHFNRN